MFINQRRRSRSRRSLFRIEYAQGAILARRRRRSLLTRRGGGMGGREGGGGGLLTRLRSRGKRNSLLGGADRRSDETYRIPPGHLRCQPDTPTPEAGAALCPGRNVHNTHSFLHAPWPLVLHRVHSPLTHIRIQLPGLVSRIDCCAVKALPCNAGALGGSEVNAWYWWNTTPRRERVESLATALVCGPAPVATWSGGSVEGHTIDN